MKITILPQELIGQPDVVAMLQAFYSRSHTSIEDRIKDLTEDNANIKESLKRYWINYGHDSIGDCGVLPIFIEGVSMLTAKAIQDNPLYNGQETSSRYVDYSQYLDNPPTNLEKKYHKSHNTWLSFYKEVFEYHYSKLTKLMPEKEAKIKAFDLSRGFLPVTVRTNLSVAMTVRQLRYQLHSIVNTHPLSLVRNEVNNILEHLLNSQYKDLFSKCPSTLKTKWYLDENTKLNLGFGFIPDIDLLFKDGLYDLYTAWGDKSIDEDFMPSQLFSGLIDFGSYRDLQRHRSMTIRSTMPSIHSLTNRYYLDLSYELSTKLNEILKDLIYTSSGEGATYNSILANNVIVHVKASLPMFKYLVNLRTQPTVHKTLRDLVKTWANNVKVIYDIDTNISDSQENDYQKRATQDIIEQ